MVKIIGEIEENAKKELKLDRLDRSLSEQGVLRISLSDVVGLTSKGAKEQDMTYLSQKVGKFFRHNRVQVERLGIGKGERICLSYTCNTMTF